MQLDLRAISLAEGLRAALSVALIVLVAQVLGDPALMEAALGALFTCLCDPGGVLRRRLLPMLSFAGFGFLLTAGFALLRAHGLGVTIPVACLAIFATSFVRVWGQSAMVVGNLLTVAVLLAVVRPEGVAGALLLGGTFAAGSLWAVLLTVVIWPVHAYRPMRRSVGECWRMLALLAGDMRDLVLAGADAAAWEAHARAHRRAVRDAIERARAAVLETVRSRDPVKSPVSAALIRLETADQIFGALIALSDLIEQAGDPATQAGAERLLRRLRPLLLVLGEAAAANATLSPARLGRSIALLEQSCAGSPDLAHIAETLAERLRIAATLAAPDGMLPGDIPVSGEAPLLERLRIALRGNLTWQSPALRHALRCAVLAAPALWLTLSWYHGYEHWLTITLILTMQPFFALAWQRALERIIGTMAGGLLAALLAMVCTTPVTIVAALFPLTVLTYAVRQVSFGAFITCITPLVVLLSELGRPGTSEITIALMRALFTLAGGLLAVAGCVLLWPSWEPDRLRRELLGAIAAHAAYAAAELGALLGEVPPDQVEAARRAAGVASNAVETSLSRALIEPARLTGGAARDRLEAAMVLDAALRRLAGRLSSLQHAVDPRGTMPEAAWRRWREWTVAALLAMQRGEPVAPRPEGRPIEAVARIARQLELMDGALRRLRDA